MKVIDLLETAKKTLFSYEIIPPRRGTNIESTFALIDDLMKYEPPFIDLTSRSAEIYYEDQTDGTVKRHIRRKRPGTIGLSAAIKNRYNVETVPHLLCSGFTREETEDALIELNFLGINNVLAVRGDVLRKNVAHEGRTKNQRGVDLVKQIHDMNSGIFLEDLVGVDPTNFCIGVGGYPEKHFEAPNIDMDIQRLKEKVAAGADYIVTQMFYDNSRFFKFVEECRTAGISIPIVPGIKIITKEIQLTTIPRTFFVDIPKELSDQMINQPTEDAMKAGITWTLNQCNELIEAKVPCIHFYVMSSTSEISEVVSQLK